MSCRKRTKREQEAFDMGRELGRREAVRHGRWDSKYDEHDGFYHHFCTECKHLAIFTYDERDDYDEGMDGEWHFLGKDIVGIKENLTNYCPNCGAKMDGGGDDDQA